MKDKKITIKLPNSPWEHLRHGHLDKPTYHMVQRKGKGKIWWLDYNDEFGNRLRKSLSTGDKAEALKRRKQWIENIEAQLNK